MLLLVLPPPCSLASLLIDGKQGETEKRVMPFPLLAVSNYQQSGPKEQLNMNRLPFTLLVVLLKVLSLERWSELALRLAQPRHGPSDEEIERLGAIYKEW